MRFQALTTLLVLVGALAAPAARAQQPPAGSFGFVTFTAPDTSTSLQDSLMAINLNGTPNPFPSGGPASSALTVDIPLNAGGIPLVAARSQQRRGMQAPREAELAPVFDAGNPFPAIFIPAEDAQGFGFVTSVDFRGGPPFSMTNTTPIPLNGRGVPYEILRNSAFPYVYYTTTNAAGILVVVEVNYATVGAPVVTATYTVGGPGGVGGPPTPYATRLTDTGSGRIAIPWAGGVDIVSMPGLGFVSTNPTPLGFDVGTNVASGWKGFYGYDLICGLQGAASGPPQHGYMTINSSVIGGSSFPVTNPFGNAPSGQSWRFAAGFYDIAITRPSGAPGPANATFLLDDPAAIGTSVNTQVVTVTQNQFFTTTANTIAQGSVFGNPEVIANAPAAVVFMVSNSSGPDLVGAIWPSVPALPQQVVSMTGFVDPATVDRPLALPGGNEFAVPASAGPPFGIELFTVGNGTLAPSGPGPINTMSPASGLPNVVIGGLAGTQPVYMQGFTAFDVAVAGFPFATSPLPVMSAPLTTPNAVTGLLLTVPMPPSTQPTFGARQAMLNFADGLPTNVRLLYPVTSGGPGGGSQIDVFSPSTVPTSGQWRHPNGLKLTSELYSF